MSTAFPNKERESVNQKRKDRPTAVAAILGGKTQIRLVICTCSIKYDEICKVSNYNLIFLIISSEYNIILLFSIAHSTIFALKMLLVFNDIAV